MKVPLSYTWRSLWTRRLTTILTVAGIALVSFVFASVLMLSRGVENALVETGSDNNAIMLRKAASSELVSQIGRDASDIVKTYPEVVVLPNGNTLASSEIVVVINLKKVGSNDMGNISVRGVSPEAMHLRPQVSLSSGKMFQFGSNEVVVGTNVASRFQGAELGRKLRFGDAEWTIVGIMQANGTAFDSEIWGDVEQFIPAFGRPLFSSVLLRMKSSDLLSEMTKRLAGDPRLQHYELKRETAFYREQAGLMAGFISFLGLGVTLFFCWGAVIGAMITMYAAVANRTTEIGTMRALGFRRRSILSAFMVESLLLSLVGGIVGILLASLMSFVRISTTNFGSFSELGFGFALAPDIVVATIVFSLLMGIIGGFLPAWHASRLNILAALRSA